MDGSRPGADRLRDASVVATRMADCGVVRGMLGENELAVCMGRASRSSGGASSQPVYATSVPFGPTTSSSARTTVSAPPTIVPRADMRQWTSATLPVRRPSSRMSRASCERPTSMGPRLARLSGDGRRSACENAARARNRDRRGAVGRRGEGQDRRPAGPGVRPRLPLPGWPECRAHHRRRRRDLQDQGDSVGDRRRCRERDRRRVRRRPPGADRRARRARGTRASHRRARLRLRQRPPDHAVARRARRRPRAPAREAADRHDATRDRAGLRGQGDPDRHPRPGPARPEDPAREGRAGGEREERLARARVRHRPLRRR